MTTPEPSQAVDTIQILMCEPGKVSSKTFTKLADGEIAIKNYDLGVWFIHNEFPVSSIATLSEVLTALEHEQQAIVIRGAAVSEVPVGRWVRRKGSGDGDQFTGNFMTPLQGHRWLMVDVDKVKLPRRLPLSAKNLPNILNWVISELPGELHDVSCHWQLSSSAGVFANDRLSLHLWYWLNEPVPDSELKAWALAHNERSVVVKIDTSLFQHVQPHYTAKPIFVDMPDPIPVRSGLLHKKHAAATIAVSIPINNPAAATVYKTPKTPHLGKSDSRGFLARLADIGDHPGGRGFRQALLSATVSYVRANGGDGVDPEQLYRLLHDAVLKADASAHTPTEIEERGSRETLMPMIKSAIVKYGSANSTTPRKPKLHQGIEPHFLSQPMSVEAIQAELSNMLPSVRSSNAYGCK